MKKKIIAISVVWLLCLTGCGGDGSESKSSDNPAIEEAIDSVVNDTEFPGDREQAACFVNYILDNTSLTIEDFDNDAVVSQDMEEASEILQAYVTGSIACGLEIDLFSEDDSSEDVLSSAGNYGDDPYLDKLYDQCADGDNQACNDLYLQSPGGSEYEAFGNDCGGRGGLCETSRSNYGDDPYLDKLWQQCADGDNQACNDLYLQSPVGSEYEAFGSDCGGRGGLCETSSALNMGTLLPETGVLAFLSAPMLEGVNMAIADINAAGGVNGADVTLTPGDSGTDPEIANITVDRLLLEDVDAIIGAAASGITGSVIDRITSASVTQCSPSNTAAGLGTSGDNGFYFRTAPSDDLQAPALANVVLGDGYTNVAVVSRADDYGVGFNAEFEPAIEAGGGTVVWSTQYAPEATSFDDVVQDVVASGPDAVVLVAFEEGVQIIQTMIEQGAGPDAIQIYITDGMASSNLGEFIDESNPGIASGMKGTQPAAAPSSGADFFPAAFAEFAPGVSTIFSAQSYDCAILIALAAEAAGSNDSADIAAAMVDVSRDGEKCSTFADCKDLLAGGTNIDYDGASGAIDFLDVGEPGTGIYEVYEYNAYGLQEVIDELTYQSNR